MPAWLRRVRRCTIDDDLLPLSRRQFVYQVGVGGLGMTATELTALWRTRQFESSWLRVVAHEYADFWQCTADALRFAAASLNVQLTAAQRERLMNATSRCSHGPTRRPHSGRVGKPAAVPRFRVFGNRWFMAHDRWNAADVS